MESIHLAKSSQQTWQYTFAFKSVNFCDEKTGQKKMGETQLSRISFLPFLDLLGFIELTGKLAIMCAEKKKNFY